MSTLRGIRGVSSCLVFLAWTVPERRKEEKESVWRNEGEGRSDGRREQRGRG